MKYSISRNQQFFFEQNQYIEFDELLSPQEQKSLFAALKNISVSTRDVTNTSESVKTITHMSRLAKLASELTRVDHLRFGFDQVLCPPITISNFQDQTCIQGLVCILYICLDRDVNVKKTSPGEKEGASIVGKQPEEAQSKDIESEDKEMGHSFFALPTTDLSKLPLKPDARYFVVGWAEKKALYILQPKDVHTHQLKKQGYVFGDRLNEQWHPTLIR